MTVNQTTPKGTRRTTTASKKRGEAAQADQAEQREPSAAAVAHTPLPLTPSITTALHAASDKKAGPLVVLDLNSVAGFTDYFVITSGTNQRQVQAIADEIVQRLKQAGERPARVEGYKTAEWVLLDYGDFIVHIFEDKARHFYDLERLWRDAARIELPPELRDETDSSLRQES